MRRLCSVVAIAALTSVSLAWTSAPRRLCSGMFPPNNLKIPVGSKDAAGLNHQQFDQVLDRIQAVYGPIVAAHGGNLLIDRRWDDATVNASATRSGNQWSIHMYGGLARHAAMTQDGFTLVACHELGHHLGGFPKVWMLFSHWASNEGQSDYYGNLKCVRRMFADPGTSSFSNNAFPVDPVAQAKCAQSFKDHDADIGLCVRSSMAGLSLATLLQTIGHESATPSLAKKDKNVVIKTDNAHPKAQCRLDTYFQASLCTKSVSEDVDNGNPIPGTCTESQGYEVGMRPLCWYKPSNGELRKMTPIAMVQPGPAFSSLENSNLWQGR